MKKYSLYTKDEEKELRWVYTLVNHMLEKPMTEKQKRLLKLLRRKVKAGEITVKEAHEIWRR